MANDLVRVLTPLEAVNSRRERIEELTAEILHIQGQCPHLNLATEQCLTAQTGASGNCVDVKWTMFHCHDCDKRWNSEITYELSPR